MKCIHHKKYTTCYLCKEIKNKKYFNHLTSTQITKLCHKLSQIQFNTC